MRTGHRRLLLDRERTAALIELDDPVALGIFDPVAKHRCPGLLGYRGGQVAAQALAEEDVVTENERDVVIADEVRPEDERLRYPLRACLLGVGEAHAELRAVAQ